MITPKVTRTSFLDVNNLVFYEGEQSVESENDVPIDIRKAFGKNK